MAQLSSRAAALFKPADPAAPRSSREESARECLAQAGCPPFLAYVDYLATFAGGTFVFHGDPQFEEVRFPGPQDEFLLSRFGDRKVHDPDWLRRCRPDMLPGGRDPDDWDLHVGPLGSAQLDGSMWPDGSVRFYHGAFSWSRPVARSLGAYQEAEAAVVDGVRRGYSSAWAATPDPDAAVGLARTWGLGADPVADAPPCRCWAEPGRRAIARPAAFDHPGLFD